MNGSILVFIHGMTPGVAEAMPRQAEKHGKRNTIKSNFCFPPQAE